MSADLDFFSFSEKLRYGLTFTFELLGFPTYSHRSSLGRKRWAGSALGLLYVAHANAEAQRRIGCVCDYVEDLRGLAFTTPLAARMQLPRVTLDLSEPFL